MDIDGKIIAICILLAIIAGFFLLQLLSKKTLIITVDAEGNHTQIRNILDVLDNEKVKATFFVVGQTCEKYPELCKEIAKKHDIACHTYSHSNLKGLSEKEQRYEIVKGRKAIQNITNIKCTGFRAPYFKADSTTYNILEEEGFSYDISGIALFPPIKHFTPTLWGEYYSTHKLKLSYRAHWNFVKLILNLKRTTIITIHPQYIANTEENLSLFRDFIRYAKSRNAKIITMKELVER